MIKFEKFVYTPAGYHDATLAIAACRAGGVGILNAELGTETEPELVLSQLDFLSQKAGGRYGLKLDDVKDSLLAAALGYARKGMHWLILDAEIVLSCQEWIAKLKQNGAAVLAEVKTAHWPDGPLDDVVDGLVLKGNESGGFVGESSSFILLQKWRKQTSLPLWLRGGVTPNVAAASTNACNIGVGLRTSMIEIGPFSPWYGEMGPW